MKLDSTELKDLFIELILNLVAIVIMIAALFAVSYCVILV